jgi:hypothetical protein
MFQFLVVDANDVWDFLSMHPILDFSIFFFFLFYSVKGCDEYDGRRSQWQQTKMQRPIICYINGVWLIEKALATFGKDGRFQSWCCLACKYVFHLFVVNHLLVYLFRLHLLSEWFQLLSQCSDACLTQFYDPSNNCFRQEKLNPFIINILESVRDFHFAHLESALLKRLADVWIICVYT